MTIFGSNLLSLDDAKYSIERFMGKSAFRARFDVVQSVDVVDRHTLRVSLKEPSAPFLNHLAASTFVAILPREVEEKLKDFNRPEAMIGTGPFMLKSYQKGVQIAFEKNPDYHVKGLPYLDGVVIEITPESSTRLSLLRAGKVDLGHMWGFLVPEEAKSLKQTNPEMVQTPTMILGSGILYFRTDQPPFNDVRVRRAISLAIDRKSWNDSLHYGEACVDSGPVPCAMADWKLPASKMDPAKAKYLVGYDPAGSEAPPGGGGLPEGLHHAHVPLAGLRAALADLLRSRRRRPREDRRHRRVQARGVRQVHLHDLPRQVRKDGDGPAGARLRGRRLARTAASSRSSPTTGATSPTPS